MKLCVYLVLWCACACAVVRLCGVKINNELKSAVIYGALFICRPWCLYLSVVRWFLLGGTLGSCFLFICLCAFFAVRRR